MDVCLPRVVCRVGVRGAHAARPSSLATSFIPSPAALLLLLQVRLPQSCNEEELYANLTAFLSACAGAAACDGDCKAAFDAHYTDCVRGCERSLHR